MNKLPELQKWTDMADVSVPYFSQVVLDFKPYIITKNAGTASTVLSEYKVSKYNTKSH